MTVFQRASSRVLQLVGLDAAVIYTLIWRAVSAGSGVATLAFVAIYLTQVEQGFYVTFASLAGLKVFLELGFSNVIVQFASHEKAFLTWTPGGTLEGEDSSRFRLASLVHLAVVWYSVMALIFIGTVLPGGFWFFTRYSSGATPWALPWALTVVATGLLLITAPLLAVLEGCGQVSSVARIRFVETLVSGIVFFGALYMHKGLLALPLQQFTSFLCQLVFLCIRRYSLFLSLLKTSVPPASRIHWAKEIWPFHWRIALSWMSGYFVFQLFNPILFASRGPREAGQMGLSMMVIQGINSAGIAWVSTKAPTFGALIARRKFDELDTVFQFAMQRSLSVVAAVSVVVMAGIAMLSLVQHPWSNRFLPPLGMFMLILAGVLNTRLFSQAIYLRAHKQEPLLGLSIFNGVGNAICAVVFGRMFGAMGIAASFFVMSVIVSGIYGPRLFQRKRKEWHEPTGAHVLATPNL